MLRLAIFDLGNVVFSTHFDASYAFWARLTGQDESVLKQAFAMDEAFHAFERGELSPQQYHTHLCRLLNIKLSYNEFCEGWCAIYGDYIPGTIDTIRKLKPHCTVVALTNTNEIHNEVWPTRYQEAIQLFDALYISSQIGLRKPERACFEYVLSQHAVAPGETIFFDDSPVNVAAARELGMIAILVTDAVAQAAFER